MEASNCGPFKWISAFRQASHLRKGLSMTVPTTPAPTTVASSQEHREPVTFAISPLSRLSPPTTPPVSVSGSPFWGGVACSVPTAGLPVVRETGRPIFPWALLAPLGCPPQPPSPRSLPRRCPGSSSSARPRFPCAPLKQPPPSVAPNACPRCSPGAGRTSAGTRNWGRAMLSRGRAVLSHRSTRKEVVWHRTDGGRRLGLGSAAASCWRWRSDPRASPSLHLHYEHSHFAGGEPTESRFITCLSVSSFGYRSLDQDPWAFCG